MAVSQTTAVEPRGDSVFDAYRVRADFPILEAKPRGQRVVYLDNAATSQKPRAVIDAMRRYYEEENANVHRGVHVLSQIATDRYEAARGKVAHFLGSPVVCEIIFTRGTTEAINLVAHTYGEQHVGAGDEVLISHMEHHSNIVPWQMLCERKGATLRVIPIDGDGALCMEDVDGLLSARTKILAITHVSNALGTVNPIKEIVALAHAKGVPVLVDGAQSAPHMPINIKDLDCDFYACSAHKMYGPTGVGILYGRGDILEAMPPWQGGGDMILSVTFEKTRYNAVPYKFEAGTPNIEGVIGLGAAIDYLEVLGMENIAAHEKELLAYATDALTALPGVQLIGTAPEKAGVLSFTMENVHPHDIGQILDGEGVAIRAGHHCAQPVMQRFGVPATARASLGIYNTTEDIDALVRALHKVDKVFA